MPLNDRQIKAFKPKAKPYKKYDSDGLFMLIHPNGSKYWRYKYQFGGKAQTMALGVYPNVPLIEARRTRDEAKTLLNTGVNPMAERGKAKAATIKKQEQTFEAVAEKWLLLQSSKLAPKTIKNIRNRLDKHLYPTLKNLPIADIRRHQLIDIGDTMNEAGTHEEAKKTIQTAGQIFNFAILHELIENNPATTVNTVLITGETTHHPAIPQAEVKQFYKDLITTGAEEATKHALLLLMITGARNGALRLSQWQHIDFDNKTWYMPADNMKMGNDFLIPLSGWAIDILEERKQTSGHQTYIFPADKKGGAKQPIMSGNAINRFIAKMGYDGKTPTKSKAVAHGFRSLMTDVCLENNFSQGLVKKALAHTERDKAFAAYYRTDMIEERRKMAGFYSDWLHKQFQEARNEIALETIESAKANIVRI